MIYIGHYTRDTNKLSVYLKRIVGKAKLILSIFIAMDDPFLYYV
jgi:hypothetical protein